jgi:hypothetical protein
MSSFPNLLLLTRVSLNLFPVPHLFTPNRYTRFETINSIYGTCSHCLNWLPRLLQMVQSASCPARLTHPQDDEDLLVKTFNDSGL